MNGLKMKDDKDDDDILPRGFMEELIEAGPASVLGWYREHCECCSKDGGRCAKGFNTWSEAAKRLADATRHAIGVDDRERALTFAGVACHIYENVLPKMTDELSCVEGLGKGVLLTEIEAMDIRIQLLNRFGPQQDPFLFTVDMIEKWFFKDLDMLCIHSLESTISDWWNKDLDEKRQAQLLSFQAQVNIVNRLDERLVPNRIKDWMRMAG